MKKFLISLTLLILFTISILILYLSFYGYQTDRFNKIIKTEIEKNQKIINLDFKKISFLLDIKKINLLVKFIDPKIEYKSIEIPIKSLKANLDLVLIIKNEVGIRNVELETNYIDIDLLKPQMLNLLENKLIKINLKKLEKGKVKFKSLFIISVSVIFILLVCVGIAVGKIFKFKSICVFCGVAMSLKKGSS